MTWHWLHSILTKTATVAAICTTQVDLNLCAAMANSGHVELQLDSALCLFSMAEVAGVPTFSWILGPSYSHVVSFSRSSNVKFVRANTFLLINSAELACKSTILMERV
jgi:hypothetical protein